MDFRRAQKEQREAGPRQLSLGALGIDCSEAETLPEQKVDAVRRLTEVGVRISLQDL